ncbi:hypothetical protein N7490_012020 [Penicillium lividum]|nr:hypothetical protein N7490_012020 [Penicillium lividum]
MDTQVECHAQPPSTPTITISPSLNETSGDGSLFHKSSKTKHSRPQSFPYNDPRYIGLTVLAYSGLHTGSGQNHVALGHFLTDVPPTSINIEYSPDKPHDSVTLYSFEETPHGQTQKHAPRDEKNLHTSHARRVQHFQDATLFYHYRLSSPESYQSCMVFLQGYMTADWLNSVGAKYRVDPEYFCRHLDFRAPSENSNNFSIPALPSSSWHLIQLPILTIGVKDSAKGSMDFDAIEKLRRKGRDALADHHHRITRLSSSGMTIGDSMVRDYLMFDNTHFAIEQRISILFVWIDSGKEFPGDCTAPWAPGAGTRLLPVIRHMHMVALKSHLFADSLNNDRMGDPRQSQSASHLHVHYGRSLRPSLMATDAFYALHEIFSFAASSEMHFLNLIDVKLDQYTESTENEFGSLPSLKYTKEILYRHIQKIQQTLDSIRNAKHPKWPKAGTKGRDKTKIAADAIEQDFIHLLGRAEMMHKRCNEAIVVLMSSVSISESKKAISQATRVTRLTFLAFLFVPLSFTTSFLE